MFGHKNKYQNVKYKLHIKIQTIAFTSSDEAFTSNTGLSLRAGGRGFPPATQSMAPGYFRR